MTNCLRAGWVVAGYASGLLTACESVDPNGCAAPPVIGNVQPCISGQSKKLSNRKMAIAFDEQGSGAGFLGMVSVLNGVVSASSLSGHAFVKGWS